MNESKCPLTAVEIRQKMTLLLTPGSSPLPHCHTYILTGLKWCWEPLPTAHLQPPTLTHCCAGFWVIIKETNMWPGSLAPLFGHFLSPCAKEKSCRFCSYTLFCLPSHLFRAVEVANYFDISQHSSHITTAQREDERSSTHCSACWLVLMLT